MKPDLTCFRCRETRENQHEVRKILNGESNASGESSPQDFHSLSIASDEISSVGAESHSGMELKTTEKATQTKLKGIHTRAQRLVASRGYK